MENKADTIIATADLCDKLGDKLQYCDIQFKSFGKKTSFGGKIYTVKCFEDNSFVKEVLKTPGEGQVLVVDGGASLRRALVGDQIALSAVKNNWAGIVVNGCIRDSKEINEMEIGIKAIGTHPRKTEKLNVGQKQIVLEFGSVKFTPGDFLVSDEDGLVVIKPEDTPKL